MFVRSGIRNMRVLLLRVIDGNKDTSEKMIIKGSLWETPFHEEQGGLLKRERRQRVRLS